MPRNPVPHLGFPIAVEICRGAARLLALCTVTAVRACAARHSARSRTAHTQEMLRNAIALSFRRHSAPGRSLGPSAFTGHVSPPAGEPAAFHLFVRTFARTRDRDAP